MPAGVWRYTIPVRPPPLQEDEVPFQGLGATDSGDYVNHESFTIIYGKAKRISLSLTFKVPENVLAKS